MHHSCEAVGLLTNGNRDKLRDQNALSEEIVNAITGNQLDMVDDADLEDELDQLQQEALDEQMLKTGNPPISDAVHKMPSPANAERKFSAPIFFHRYEQRFTNTQYSRVEQEAGHRRGRRGGRIPEVASRDGYVDTSQAVAVANVCYAMFYDVERTWGGVDGY